MAVTKRTRFEVLRRDNHTCRYCGALAAESPLTIDHVVPVALGGSDDPSNLVAACKDCNAGKTSTAPDQTLVTQVSDDAVRWSRALTAAAAERLALYEANMEIGTEFRKVWDQWKTSNGKGSPLPMPANWLVSIKSFLAAGLTVTDFEELVEVAMGSPAKDVWKYFCGCCWTRIRESQTRAAQIIAEEDQDADVEGFPSVAEQQAWTGWFQEHFMIGGEVDEIKRELFHLLASAKNYADDWEMPEVWEDISSQRRAWFDELIRDKDARIKAATLSVPVVTE